MTDRPTLPAPAERMELFEAIRVLEREARAHGPGRAARRGAAPLGRAAAPARAPGHGLPRRRDRRREPGPGRRAARARDQRHRRLRPDGHPAPDLHGPDLDPTARARHRAGGVSRPLQPPHRDALLPRLGQVPPDLSPMAARPRGGTTRSAGCCSPSSASASATCAAARRCRTMRCCTMAGSSCAGCAMPTGSARCCRTISAGPCGSQQFAGRWLLPRGGGVHPHRRRQCGPRHRRDRGAEDLGRAERVPPRRSARSPMPSSRASCRGARRSRRSGSLARLYVGPGLSFDVEVVLDRREVPGIRLGAPGPGGTEARLEQLARIRAAPRRPARRGVPRSRHGGHAPMTTDWTRGYVADLEYSAKGFYGDLAPNHIDLVCLINGVVPPRRTEGFTYCELGSGLGLTATALAAVNPDGEFYAVDFNPAHTARADDLGAEGRLDQHHLYRGERSRYAGRRRRPGPADVRLCHPARGVELDLARAARGHRAVPGAQAQARRGGAWSATTPCRAGPARSRCSTCSRSSAPRRRAAATTASSPPSTRSARWSMPAAPISRTTRLIDRVGKFIGNQDLAYLVHEYFNQQLVAPVPQRGGRGSWPGAKLELCRLGDAALQLCRT